MDELTKTLDSMRGLIELEALLQPAPAQLPALTTGSRTLSANTAQEPEKPVLLREDGHGRDQLIETLRFCWNTLHRYGKTSDDFDGIVKTYLSFLGRYPTDVVASAFDKYIRHRREFPTPADIIAIIQGRVKRDGTYYTRLCRKIQENAFVTDDELAYMRLYEGQVCNDWE
jgi:hypothetical protein